MNVSLQLEQKKKTKLLTSFGGKVIQNMIRISFRIYGWYFVDEIGQDRFFCQMSQKKSSLLCTTVSMFRKIKAFAILRENRKELNPTRE